jgi:glycosyltransferase involved in cell wall biosynthesis
MSAIVADYGQAAREVKDGIELVKGVPEKISTWSVPEALWNLARSMSSVSADVFVVGGAPRLATAVFAISKLLRKKFIFRLVNDSDVQPSYLRRRYPQFFLPLYRLAVRYADAVMPQTKRQKSLLLEHFGVDAQQVPYGYDLPQEKEVWSQRDREYVLWVGSSDPDQKNPMSFVEISRGLPEYDFVMISQPIAGMEDYHKSIREEAGKVRNLKFTGPVDPDKIHDYYRKAMMVVNTSGYEGFPNTFLEAWRYETPVVSLHFDLDGLLGEGCGGIKVGSMESSCEVIDRVASDVEYRESLGKRGRKYMRQNLSMEKVSNLYEKIIISI